VVDKLTALRRPGESYSERDLAAGRDRGTAADRV